MNAKKPSKKAKSKKGNNTKRVGVKSNEGLKRARYARLAATTSKNRNTRRLALARGARLINWMPKITELNEGSARSTVTEVTNIPMFLIDAHSCICAPSKDKCFGNPYTPVMTLPKDTFFISFAQSGEAACTNPGTVWSKEEDMRRYLYTHSEGDVGGNNSVGRTHFSFFSGIRRAVGGRNKRNNYTTKIPNVNYTMNEFERNPDGSLKKGPDGKKILIAQEKNPYGVYDANDPRIMNVAGYYAPNNTLSLLPQEAGREDWTLKQIIEEVYRIKGIRSAIFVSLGCLTPCGAAVTSEDLTEAGALFDRANAEYVNLRETFTAEEMGALGIPPPMNLGIAGQYAFPNTREVIAGIEEGLHGEGLLHIPKAYHFENRRAIAEALKASKAAANRFVSGASGK